MTAEQIREQDENEIDLVEVVQKLWRKRKFIFKVTLIFACLGVLVALFSAKEFQADCIIVPQSGGKNVSSGLGGLAAMAGINIGSMEEDEVLSPKIYPKVLASVPFQKELMKTRIKFEDYEQPVSLIDYYTNDEYRKFSLIGVILKYTIGLPGTIMKARDEKKPDIAIPDDSNILTLSRQESQCMRVLKDKVTLNVNEKEGTVNLTAVMPEPLAAAQVASVVQGMLQRYVTEFKIEKAQAKLGFIEKRYVDAKKQFEVKQEELAQFRDANRNFASAIAKATEERLSNEYTVALGVYSELAKQREQAGIQVKEDTPIFTIVEPVTVPNEPSKPKRALILVAFVFLGGFIGIGLVLVLPFVAQISGSKRLQAWLPEDEA